MVLEKWMSREFTEDMFVASVGWCNFLVKLFLVDGQSLVGYVVVGVWSTAVTVLREDVEAMPIRKGNAMLK